MPAADIEPTVEYAFKRVFGSANNEPLLAELTNAVVSFPAGRRARDMALHTPFSVKEYAEAKATVLDIRATDALGRQFHVEMQRVVPWGFDKRVLYYWAGEIDLDALPPSLDVPPICKALEALVAFSKTELDWQRYRDRVRAEREKDSYWKDLLWACSDGVTDGELMGRIRLAQQLLKQPISSIEELKSMTRDERGRLDDLVERQLLAAAP